MLKIDNTMEIVFATGNRHKVEEAAQILGPEFRLRTPAELGITEDIPETSDTLEGNALQKAEYVYNKTGLPCFSDDTGLFVDALGGAPGVLSARYAGPGKKAEDNVRKLLSRRSSRVGLRGRLPQLLPERTALATILSSFRKNTALRGLSPSLLMSRRTRYPTVERP